MQPDFEHLPGEDLPVPDLPVQEPHTRFSARRLLNVATGLVALVVILAATPLWLPAVTNLWQRFFPGPDIYVQQNTTLEALATSDGHVVWRVQHISPVSPAYLYHGVIYAATDNAIVAERASDGHQLWRAETGPVDRMPDAVADQRVYYTSNLNMVALDAASGKVAWQAPASDGQQLQGIQVMYGDGQVLTCEDTAGQTPQDHNIHMLSRSAATGTVRWQQTLKNIDNTNTTNCFQLNNLIVLSNYLNGDSSSDFTVFDAQQGRQLWQRTVSGIIGGIDQHSLYVGQEQDTQLVAYNLNNGIQRWSLPISSSQETYLQSLNVLSTAENGQYGTTASDKVVVDTGKELDGVASATGHILWRHSEQGSSLIGGLDAVGPHGIIYAVDQNDESISAINSADGSIVWNVPFPSTIQPHKVTTLSLFFWQDTLFLNDGEHLLAFDPSTGMTRWQASSLPVLQPIFTVSDFNGQGQP